METVERWQRDEWMIALAIVMASWVLVSVSVEWKVNRVRRLVVEGRRSR